MMGTLLMSLVSCLIAISQASLINRCDLARVLYKEDLDGFEGYSLTDYLLSPNLLSTISCAKKIVSGAGGMKNWVAWRLHCAGRPLSYWMTGCFLG
ncbi:lysozyme-like protein 6 isoform X2 [Leptonychotes weddellii]|nr:lysozyme-like protein 6 isoform X2 [Leptonychotes weddellii]